MKLATEYSICVLESHSVETEREGKKWLDLNRSGVDYLNKFLDEMTFLESIGRLRRHAKEPGLVRILEVLQ
jgi:hypothetical protein